MSTFVQVEGLTVRFGGLTAVQALSFEVARGSVHALIGPNGAGKSTTFNCISRYVEPTAGRIAIDGVDVLRLAPHRMAGLGIARTFQNLELFGDLPVLENVLLGCYAHAAATLRQKLAPPPAALRRRCEELLERVGLAAHRHQRAKDLDFGRQKMLEIARALAIEPRLLLLDEPAAGLRNREIEQLDRLLVGLARDHGITVLLVEHVMALVMSVSDRITVMSFGQKIAEGTPSEIRAHPDVIAAYLGKGAAPLVAAGTDHG